MADNNIIVAEPMSTISCPTTESLPPTPTTCHASTPPSSASTHAFPRSLSPCKSQALKPNPHPYPIRTTSTGVLSRSNSTASANTYQYQYYVPQSPGSPQEFRAAHNNTGGLGDKERKGGRHKYSKSLNLDGGPTPLPFPPTLGRRDSNSSLSSVGGASPTKMDEETGRDGEAPGEVPNHDIGRRIKEDMMPPSPAAPVISASKMMRGRPSRSLGTGEGGRVKGMVASLERSASLSEDDGDDSVAAETPYGRYGSSDVLHEHGRQRAKYRRERVASDASASSASSLDSFDGFKPSAHANKTESEGDSSLLTDKNAFQAASIPFDSASKRNGEQPRGTAHPNGRAIEEPTVEELLASAPWDPASFTNVSANGTICDETVKMRHADVTNSTAATITITSIPNDLSVFDLSFSPSQGTASQGPPSSDGERTLEELIGTLSSSSLSMSAGASAWERDIGSTVKLIERGEDPAVSNQGLGRSGRIKSQKEVKHKEKKRLEDLFSMETPESTPEPALPEADHPDIVQLPPSPTASERELKLAQEMAETKEMVRALSARVAGVETKIGEMEVAAEELQQRGRELAEDGQAHIEKEKEESSSSCTSCDSAQRTVVPQTLARRLAVSFSRSLVGVAQSLAEREGACATLVRMFLPSSSVPASSAAALSAPSSSSSKLRSRETFQKREALSTWYKKSWACYLVFLGLGACAFVMREVVRRGLMLRERKT